MRPLINITDVRQFGELSKQKNADNFAARVRNVQDNQLQDLFGDILMYDFFNYLDNNWLSFGGAFTRDSTVQITANKPVGFLDKNYIQKGSKVMITVEYMNGQIELKNVMNTHVKGVALQIM